MSCLMFPLPPQIKKKHAGFLAESHWNFIQSRAPPPPPSVIQVRAEGRGGAPHVAASELEEHPPGPGAAGLHHPERPEGIGVLLMGWFGIGKIDGQATGLGGGSFFHLPGFRWGSFHLPGLRWGLRNPFTRENPRFFQKWPPMLEGPQREVRPEAGAAARGGCGPRRDAERRVGWPSDERPDASPEPRGLGLDACFFWRKHASRA